MYVFQPKRVCSQAIGIELDGDVVKSVQFMGGCNGNLQAVARLVEGKTVDECEALLSGINCAGRGTSCADQMVRGMREALAAQG